jgi:hypothetical protein
MCSAVIDFKSYKLDCEIADPAPACLFFFGGRDSDEEEAAEFLLFIATAKVPEVAIATVDQSLHNSILFTPL